VGHSHLHRIPSAGLIFSRRSLLASAAALLAFPAFSEETIPGNTLDEITERGFITIGLYDEFAPYSYLENGEIKGVDAEIGKIIAKALGVEAKLELRRADENVDADLRSHVWRGPVVGGGVVNVMLHMPINRDLALRNDMVVMGAPYASEKTVLSWSKSQLGDIPTMTDFTEYRIAVENDSMADFFLASAAGGAFMKNMDHVKTMAEAVDLMTKGDVAAVMGPKAQIEFELAKVGDRRKNFGVGETTPPGLQQGNWAFGFAVRTNYRDLFYAVEEALNNAMADGSVKAAYEKYGLTYTPPPPPVE
jgi:ABC-type amino acid transport substrate-binding protein